MSLRFGLAANRRHHEGHQAALFRWLRASERGIRELQLGLHAVGRTFDAIQQQGLLDRHTGLLRYPMGRDGGLMKLVSGIAGGTECGDAPVRDRQHQHPVRARIRQCDRALQQAR